MRCEPPDKHFFTEIRDLNVEFLALITDPRVPPGDLNLFGLPLGVVTALRGLDSEQRRFIAESPGLLAGIGLLPAASQLADGELHSQRLAPGWQAALRVFATGLLTYVWQLARRDRLAAALCVGPKQGLRRELAEISFRDIQARAGLAAQAIEARHADHPRWWTDLICAARSGDVDLRERCRLDLIVLGLAEPASERLTALLRPSASGPKN